MNDKPRVSVGLPVYNGDKFLRQALDSLLAQTYSEFELIISDNASADGTEQICREYCLRDGRISYHRLPQNNGVTANFNRVFELSKGEYFRWASADDFIAADLTERCVYILDNEPDVVLCYAKTMIVNENGLVVAEYDDNLDLRWPRARDRYCHLEKNIGLCNAPYGLIRSDVLRKTRLFGNYIRSDEVFLGELALHGQFREIPERLFFRRFHPEAASSIKKAEDLSEHYKPGEGKVNRFHLWRHLFEKMACTLRSPLDNRERARICFLLLGNAIKDRGSLMEETRSMGALAMKALFSTFKSK